MEHKDNYNFTPPPFDLGGLKSQVSRAATSTNVAASASSSEIPRATKIPLRMGEMMNTKTGTFQSWIQNINDFHQVNKEYLQIHDRRGGDNSDFPLDAKKQQELVKALFEAANDCSQTFEPEGSLILKRIQQRYYADLEFELALWPLLMSIRDAQAGQCNIPNYHSSKFPAYNVYGSFIERFDAVYEALKSSKDVVASLFKDDTFKHRLAWRPKSELSTKVVNRKHHTNRDIQIHVGTRTILQNDIKPTANGELVDRNGQTYGSIRKRTATFESRIEKTKTPKKERPSNDTSSSKTIVAANTDDLETPDEISQQNHTFQAEPALQELLAPIPGSSPSNTDGDVFRQIAPSMEGTYSDPFLGSDDSDFWSPFFKNGDSAYPPLDD
ncbi:hypothetical protein F4805DRAFT_447375 [Annulohypoxylon moriforme]|nr:hypothetical protein F4805DRAFT_447375 [Annulohypoxylon moriforme]